jgi:hypothetical protein
LTYLERQICYGPEKKLLFKKQLFDLEVESQGPTKVITSKIVSGDPDFQPRWLPS